MKMKLLDILVDPIDLRPLNIEELKTRDDEVHSGYLHARNGMKYEIENGIPRFVSMTDEYQQQTSESFGYKWKKEGIKESHGCTNNARKWYVEKYGFKTIDDFIRFFSERNTILDLGCGSGFSSMLYLDTPIWNGNNMWVGVDISSAINLAQDRLGKITNTHFMQADALQLPFLSNTFDTVFSEGVLHHTPSTKKALFSAARVLQKGGDLLFYVYRKKGPVREFADDYIRKEISHLSHDEALDTMHSLTLLGKALSDLHAEVEVEKDIPILGIKKGRYDIQRLIYWNFAKLFWNNDLEFEENVITNFDWYSPHYAHRHTASEIRDWCSEADMKITWFHEQESGFTVKANKL